MTKPTQAQIEVAEIANRLREIAVTLLASTSEDWVVLKAADMLTALTAAAEAGEQGPDLMPKYFYDKPGRTLLTKEQIETTAIERCAQVVENNAQIPKCRGHILAIAAAIRAMKDDGWSKSSAASTQTQAEITEQDARVEAAMKHMRNKYDRP